MASADDFIALAASQIGHYGDYNKYNRWYWCDVCGYDYDPGWAWCAVFQSWCADQLGLGFRPNSASAYFAQQFPRVYEPQRGDFVLFNWDGRADQSWTDPIGVVEWANAGSSYFGTIEGNTNDGDVARCTRSRTAGYYVAFYRPEWGESEEDMATPGEIWSFRNSALETVDVYQILRDARDAAKRAEAAAKAAQAAAEKAASGSVDYKALAKAVNDDAAARMKA